MKGYHACQAVCLSFLSSSDMYCFCSQSPPQPHISVPVLLLVTVVFLKLISYKQVAARLAEFKHKFSPLSFFYRPVRI